MGILFMNVAVFQYSYKCTPSGLTLLQDIKENLREMIHAERRVSLNEKQIIELR
jgi:hypothetical protein